MTPQKILLEEKKCIEFLINLHEMLILGKSLTSNGVIEMKEHLKELRADLENIKKKFKRGETTQ